MKRLLLTGLTLFSALALDGCLFSRKGAKPKESSAIAASTEASFKERWLERRSADLKAAGLAPEAAKAQAEEEFRVRYGFIGAAKK